MPARNSIKDYIPNAYYHLYNRGVEKRDIFLDQQDFSVFLSYLKYYLLPKDLVEINGILNSKEASRQEKDKAAKLLKLKNFSENIDLLCYALMSNHFHLLVRQADAMAIDSFINALSTRYVLYFNRKYHRVGPLYQGVYKAVLIDSEAYLLHLSRYIHLNPIVRLGLPFDKWNEAPWPTSLGNYLGLKETSWLKPQPILGYFSASNPGLSYSSFVSEYQDLQPIAEFALDLNDE